MRYDRMRPHQVQAAIAAGTPVVLPLGVMEHHGGHLPAGVDLLAVTEILDRLGDEIVVLPPSPMARQVTPWQAPNMARRCMSTPPS